MPLAIDHGHARLNDYADMGRSTDAVSRLRRAGTDEMGAIGMFAMRMRGLAAEAKAAAIRRAATDARDRLRSLRPANMEDSVYNTMISELDQIINAPLSTWS